MPPGATGTRKAIRCALLPERSPQRHGPNNPCRWMILAIPHRVCKNRLDCAEGRTADESKFAGISGRSTKCRAHWGFGSKFIHNRSVIRRIDRPPTSIVGHVEVELLAMNKPSEVRQRHLSVGREAQVKMTDGRIEALRGGGAEGGRTSHGRRSVTCRRSASDDSAISKASTDWENSLHENAGGPDVTPSDRR